MRGRGGAILRGTHVPRFSGVEDYWPRGWGGASRRSRWWGCRARGAAKGLEGQGRAGKGMCHRTALDFRIRTASRASTKSAARPLLPSASPSLPDPLTPTPRRAPHRSPSVTGVQPGAGSLTDRGPCLALPCRAAQGVVRHGSTRVERGLGCKAPVWGRRGEEGEAPAVAVSRQTPRGGCSGQLRGEVGREVLGTRDLCLQSTGADGDKAFRRVASSRLRSFARGWYQILHVLQHI